MSESCESQWPSPHSASPAHVSHDAPEVPCLACSAVAGLLSTPPFGFVPSVKGAAPVEMLLLSGSSALSLSVWSAVLSSWCILGTGRRLDYAPKQAEYVLHRLL